MASCAAGCALVAFAGAAGRAQGPRAATARAGVSGAAQSRTGGAAISDARFVPALQTSSTGGSRPGIEPARVAGEMLAGAYAGIGGYFFGTWVGGLVGDALPTNSESTLDHIDFAFGITGATLATAGAVAAVGNIGDQTGSYPVTVAGAAGGVVAGVLLNQLMYGHARLASGPESSRIRWVEASLEALLPSLGATIAFNSTRKLK